MNRQQVYRDIEQLFGLVPTFLKLVPDSTLELEWELMKRIQVEDGPIPQKYRELIGIGISATTRCQYCIFFHTEMAKLFGATQEEIEHAVHYAKSSAGWSAYLNGNQVDQMVFRTEIAQIVEHLKKQMAAKGSLQPMTQQAGRQAPAARH